MKHKIAHLKKRDKTLKKVIERIPLSPIKNTRSCFESLVEAIVSQQLSVKAADTIYKRFLTIFGGRFPSAKRILAVKDSAIRKAGISYSKISFIKDVARRVENKSLDFKKIKKMSDEDAVETLMEVKGVGRWTAEMFLIFTLGREDIFSHGDLGLKNAIKKLYGLKSHPSERAAKRISDAWKPYRSLASRYLWKSL